MHLFPNNLRQKSFLEFDGGSFNPFEVRVTASSEAAQLPRALLFLQTFRLSVFNNHISISIRTSYVHVNTQNSPSHTHTHTHTRTHLHSCVFSAKIQTDTLLLHICHSLHVLNPVKTARAQRQQNAFITTLQLCRRVAERDLPQTRLSIKWLALRSRFFGSTRI